LVCYLITNARSLNTSANSAAFRQSNQFGYGPHPDLLHHVGTMDFDGLLGGTKVGGNLSVQFASDDMFKHFPLTRCERGQAGAEFEKIGLFPNFHETFLLGAPEFCESGESPDF
jgi:hypothetical protein